MLVLQQSRSQGDQVYCRDLGRSEGEKEGGTEIASVVLKLNRVFLGGIKV